jgi:hypothetical protein
MSDRQQYIKPALKAKPENIAIALRQIANMLDAADDRRKVTFYAGTPGADAVSQIALAWSQVALLIADACEVDSVTLRALAKTIDKGEQHVLWP